MLRLFLDLYRRATGFYQLRSHLEGVRRTQAEMVGLLAQQKEGIAALDTRLAALHSGLVDLRSDRGAAGAAAAEADAAEVAAAEAAAEIAACRAIADRCIFIWGPARSNTTILAEIVNSSKQTLLLAEANLYARKSGENFGTWYNAQHQSFDNQVSKSTYAPAFGEGNWWEWLQAASEFYGRLGDKMAFSACHFDIMPPEQIRTFFESRFFNARHIFTFRDPVQTLLSTGHLFQISEDRELRPYIVGWLKTAQLWADCIRTFPKTITVVDDDLSSATVGRLANFLGLDLAGADRLLDQSERRTHVVPAAFTTLLALEGELQAVYADIRATLDVEPVLWQADQKRSLAQNDTRANPKARISLAPQPVGQVWARSEHLISQLSR